MQAWGPAEKNSFYLKQWIRADLSHIDEDGFLIWATLFCVAIWWIWRWLKSFVFGRDQDITVDIGGFIHVLYNETRRSFRRATKLNPIEIRRFDSEEKRVLWKQPLEG